VKKTDNGVDKKYFYDFRGRDQQDISHQRLTDVLISFAGTAKDHDEQRGRDRVNDPDHGLLGDPLFFETSQRKDGRPDNGKTQGQSVRRQAVHIMAGHQRQTSSQDRDLGQRQVNENDLALDDMKPQIRMDPGED
jgi:hypothetical protein